MITNFNCYLISKNHLNSLLIWRRQWQPTPVLLPGQSHGWRSLVGYSWARLSDFTFTFHFHTLEKEMATHSSVLAWRIPGTGEPGGLPSMGSHRAGHDWSDLAAAAVILFICFPMWVFSAYLLIIMSTTWTQRIWQPVLFCLIPRTLSRAQHKLGDQ